MREIKFRFKIEGFGGFSYFSLDQIIMDRPYELIGNYRIISKDEYIGINDKYGNEIYDGDIVRSDLFLGKFVVEFVKGEWRINNDGLWKYKHGIEVIGNLYENPELLK